MRDTIQKIGEKKIIAITRSDSIEQLEQTVEALYAGGIRLVEVTMNTPGALQGIELLNEKFPDMVIGAGTVLDGETARSAILSGAKFILTPTLNSSVIEMANRYQIPIIPGVFTPSEVVRACELGASVVKIFPVGSLGPKYVKELRGPFSHVNMIPVGGVTLDNAREFLEIGSFAIGVGSSLVDKQLIKNKKFDELSKRAEDFVKIIEGK